MPMKRLEKRTTREILWIYILKLLRHREMYAYEIRKELQENFGFSPAVVTSYVVLYRLEKEGYVKSIPRGDKKYYRITENGNKLFIQGLNYLKSIVEKLDG
ncbi:MAG TPA: PadR family transcriptional regulator [Euryarchaeota archaeon]|nr:transcriptional regulator PadR-like family protein [archaeon BMS3Bbin15]HDL15959.1 PadR family transcriptional regulator [Euryarchaeota archaeon]